MIKKDFFGIRDIDVNELNLIDRINLHFKGGTLHDIEFSDEEMEFVDWYRNRLFAMIADYNFTHHEVDAESDDSTPSGNDT